MQSKTYKRRFDDATRAASLLCTAWLRAEVRRAAVDLWRAQRAACPKRGELAAARGWHDGLAAALAAREEK